MSERFKLPTAVFLVLMDDDKVLLMRRAHTGWHDGDYDLVAGHIDGNESLRAALTREAMEEVGITIDPNELHFSHLLHSIFSDGKEYFNVFFTAKSWQGGPAIMEPNKCDKLEWFNVNELPANLTESTRRYFASAANHEAYADSGFKD